MRTRDAIALLIWLGFAGPIHGASQGSDPCAIRELRKSESQAPPVYSPDRNRYLAKKEDKNGIAQIYVGKTGSAELTCLTCEQRPGGPKPQRFKVMPAWHPSGKWIFLGSERDSYHKPPVLGWNRKFVEGEIESGMWIDMYAVTPDGSRWSRLTDFTGDKGNPAGYTGPGFTSDGKKAIWSQIADANILVYWPFGRWELILADLEEVDGMPRLVNLKNITPKGMNWNEAAGFLADDESVPLSGSTEKDAQGMDQYILNVRTGELTNLTKTPAIWDEHGVFSPDGEKMIFMSAYPYRADPKSSAFMSLKTEFMLINKDGSDLRQLTHFQTPGYPEYGHGIAAVPLWAADGRSAILASLVFPDYEYWEIVFAGACGNRLEPSTRGRGRGKGRGRAFGR